MVSPARVNVRKLSGVADGTVFELSLSADELQCILDALIHSERYLVGLGAHVCMAMRRDMQDDLLSVVSPAVAFGACGKAAFVPKMVQIRRGTAADAVARTDGSEAPGERWVDWAP